MRHVWTMRFAIATAVLLAAAAALFALAHNG